MLFVQNWINKSYTYNSKWELLSWYVNWNTLNYLYDSNSNRVQKESINLENIKQNRYLNNDFEIENQKTLDWSWNILTQTKTNKYIYLWNNKIFTVENKDNTEYLVYNISDHLWWWSIDIN